MSNYNAHTEYFTNPDVVKDQVGDFTSFYITIAICSIFVAFLLLLNIFFCCSRYHSYWLDHNTGNRWLLPIWTKTPHKQPPLDYTELENNWLVQQQLERNQEYQVHQQLEPGHGGYDEREQFFELKKRESDL